MTRRCKKFNKAAPTQSGTKSGLKFGRDHDGLDHFDGIRPHGVDQPCPILHGEGPKIVYPGTDPVRDFGGLGFAACAVRQQNGFGGVGLGYQPGRPGRLVGPSAAML